MRNVYECEYCGKIFYNKKECFNHELEHTNGIASKASHTEEIEIVKPLNKEWISVNFENQGRCPKCGEIVVDGYKATDNNCPKCGIKLDWR